MALGLRSAIVKDNDFTHLYLPRPEFASLRDADRKHAILELGIDRIGFQFPAQHAVCVISRGLHVCVDRLHPLRHFQIAAVPSIVRVFRSAWTCRRSFDTPGISASTIMPWGSSKIVTCEHGRRFPRRESGDREPIFDHPLMDAWVKAAFHRFQYGVTKPLL